MDSKNIEPEINFRDIFYVCLKKLVIMLIAGVVIGGALFAYKIIPQKTTNDVLDVTKKISNSETDIKYNMRVQKIDRARVLCQMISNFSDQLESEQEYIDNSLYMQIDPYNVYQATAQFVIVLDNKTDGMEKILLDSYEREIISCNYLTDYSEENGIRRDYIKELISFSTTAYDSPMITTEDTNIDKACSIYVKVYGPTSEFVEDVMNIFIDEVNNIHNDLNSSLVKHSISLVSVQHYSYMNSGVRDAQISHTSHIQSLQEQIAYDYQYLDQLAKDLGLSSKEAFFKYFQTHEPVEVDGIPTETSEKTVDRVKLIKPNIKWGGIGFFVGIVLVAFFTIIRYIFAKKFLTQTQFFNLFSVKKIGVMKPVGKRSKFSTLIDFKTEDDTKLSKDNNLKLISANYNNLTKDLGKILITGTGDAKVMSEAVKALKLNGDFRPDLFNNPDVLADVTKYDGIVLLEQRNCSLISSVKNEIRLITNGGTKIIGAIIL